MIQPPRKHIVINRSPSLPTRRTMTEHVKDLKRVPPIVNDGWIYIDDSATTNAAGTAGLIDQISPMLNSALGNGDSNRLLSFFRSLDGNVHNRGTYQFIDTWNDGDVAWTYPEAFRPEMTMEFVVATVGGTSGPAKIRVDPDGSVRLYSSIT